MARPKIAAGEVGQVQVTQLANGKWRARARMRDDSGELLQLRAEGPTESDACEELLSRAKTLTTHTRPSSLPDRPSRRRRRRGCRR